jgi:hypothetical protein
VTLGTIAHHSKFLGFQGMADRFPRRSVPLSPYCEVTMPYGRVFYDGLILPHWRVL